MILRTANVSILGQAPRVKYREFDHGLVIAVFKKKQRTEYDVDLDDLDLLEDPREDYVHCFSGCHFMRIEGDICVTRYNDCTNDGDHPVDHLLLVDKPNDDFLFGPGDAIILLKEGDGFFVHEECEP